MIKNMNYYEIFPFRKEMWQMGASLCAQNSSSAVMCYSAMFLFVGDDWDDNDMVRTRFKNNNNLIWRKTCPISEHDFLNRQPLSGRRFGQAVAALLAMHPLGQV